MSAISPWQSGHSTRTGAAAMRTSVGAEVGVNLPARRLDSKDCTTDRMVNIRRSKWPMAWYKCTCEGGRETSGVGCAIPVWRKLMPCSGVPPCVPVRPGSSSCVHSCLNPPLRLACPTAGKQTTLFLSGGAYGKTYLHPPSRLPEPTGRWPQPAVGTMTACHQEPLPLLWLCNLACVGALRRTFVVAGNRNRNTHSMNLACGSRHGRVHQRPL